MQLAAADDVARTIEVIWTTGATVRRYRDGRPFDEILLVLPSGVDLTRLKAGAPVLDSHMGWSTESQRAVVEDARIEGGRGYARLRFPTKGVSAASDTLFEMARQNIIRNISVGYSIQQVRWIEPKKNGEVSRCFIEKWTPYELSFVAIPADPGAQTRSPGVGPAAAAAARARMLTRLRTSKV